jgi:GNAT superfamily N-acetyltransferase
MITAQVEAWVSFLPELKPMLPGHWEELALNKDKVPLDPRWDIYQKMDAAGELLLVTLRKDGAAIGYFIGFVHPGLHYKTCLTYCMDIFYVHPDHRGGNGGCLMIKCLEHELRRRGVQRIFMGTKNHKPAGKLFERLGYLEVETYYSKWIGD